MYVCMYVCPISFTSSKEKLTTRSVWVFARLFLPEKRKVLIKHGLRAGQPFLSKQKLIMCLLPLTRSNASNESMKKEVTKSNATDRAQHRCYFVMVKNPFYSACRCGGSVHQVHNNCCGHKNTCCCCCCCCRTDPSPYLNGVRSSGVGVLERQYGVPLFFHMRQNRVVMSEKTRELRGESKYEVE